MVFGFDGVDAINSDLSETMGWVELELEWELEIPAHFAQAQPPQCCSQGQQPDGASMDGLGR